LLKKIVRDFTVMPSMVDEASIEETNPSRFAVKAAAAKAQDVAARFPLALVVAADTIVSVGARMLGKPKNADDARRMLARLSGTTHRVITGIALCRKESRLLVSDYAITRVTFRVLTRRAIEAYIARGSFFDKAGSYAVQSKKDAFVKKIDGEYDNVVGLPTEKLRALLEAIASP
jgi:septum formation protein